MGVSGDGVQQFVDRLVDEDHRACPLWTFWRGQARAKKCPQPRPPGWRCRQMVGRYAASAADERGPAPVWATGSERNPPRVRTTIASSTSPRCTSVLVCAFHLTDHLFPAERAISGRRGRYSRVTCQKNDLETCHNPCISFDSCDPQFASRSSGRTTNAQLRANLWLLLGAPGRIRTCGSRFRKVR
jgi:hypothetical protein